MALLGLELARRQLHLDGAQAGEDRQPYRLGSPVTAAPAGDQQLHFLLHAELAQARGAFIEMLADQMPAIGVHLSVEVEVDLFEYLATVGLMRRSATHRDPSGAAAAAESDPAPLSAGMSPRSWA